MSQEPNIFSDLLVVVLAVLEPALSIPGIITGLSLLAYVTAIDYLTQQPIGLIASILVFYFGGIVGYMALTKHTSFIKNLLFGSLILFMIWTLFSPITSVGNSIVIKRVEFITLGLIFLMFLDAEFINIIRRTFHKKPSSWGGPLSGIAILILFYITGVGHAFGMLWDKYWYIGTALLLGWFAFIYFYLSKRMKVFGNKIVKKFGR